MSNWFGGDISGRDGSMHWEWSTDDGGRTHDFNNVVDTPFCDVVVDWGDGTIDRYINTSGGDTNITSNVIHYYGATGEYRCRMFIQPNTLGTSIYQKAPQNGHPYIYNTRLNTGVRQFINFGPCFFATLRTDFFLRIGTPDGDDPATNLTRRFHCQYLQDGLKDTLSTNKSVSRFFANQGGMRADYNPKSWSMWNASGINNMAQLFGKGFGYRDPDLGFNPDISKWDVSNVTNFSELMTYQADFDQDLSNWDLSSATNTSTMFIGCDIFNNGGATGIGDWNVSNVTNMRNMFASALAFNQPIGNWNTGNVTDLLSTFGNAEAFNQNINSWNVSNVTNFQRTFRRAYVFNQPLSSWNTSSGTNFFGTFDAAYAFNQDLSNWNMSNATTMRQMFLFCKDFNNGGASGIGGWTTDNVTTMESMFQCASSGVAGPGTFNQDIGGWNTSNVTTIETMFNNQPSFNNGGGTGIGGWTTDNVTNMLGTFLNCSAFNQPIGNWNTGNVTVFQQMLRGASVFNQDIGSWDLSGVNYTGVGPFWLMLNLAYAFDQDISGWTNTLPNNSNSTFVRTFENCTGWSAENYSRFLIALANWASGNGGSPTSHILDADNVNYDNNTYGSGTYTDAPTARAYLATTLGWTITDGGQV